MRGHLTDDEMAKALAGGGLGDEARGHLAGCLACRAELADLEAVVAAERRAAAAAEPDWEAMAARVMERLEGASRPRSRWRRAALAVAAAMLIAIAVGVLRVDRAPAPPATEPSVEDILAEMDELLADDRIPGFEVIDPGTGGYELVNDNGAS